MKSFFTLVCVSLFIYPEISQAQSFFANRQERSLIFTGGTGSSTYYGDLANKGSLIQFQPNVNAGLQVYVSPRISVRTELNWFVLQGSDNQANSSGRKDRGLSFTSSCFEISATGAINLFGNGNRYYRRPAINIYGFTGIGLLYFNPKANYNGKSYSLEPLHTEGVSYSRVTPVIPIGLGIRLKTGPNTNIVFEGGYRKTFTDYLDDVSSKYTAPSSNAVVAYFQNPNNPAYNPAATGTDTNNYGVGYKRGNPANTDSYFLLNVKVEYYLPIVSSSRKGTGKKNRATYRYNKRGGVKVKRR